MKSIYSLFIHHVEISFPREYYFSFFWTFFAYRCFQESTISRSSSLRRSSVPSSSSVVSRVLIYSEVRISPPLLLSDPFTTSVSVSTNISNGSRSSSSSSDSFPFAHSLIYQTIPCASDAPRSDIESVPASLIITSDAPISAYHQFCVRISSPSIFSYSV